MDREEILEQIQGKIEPILKDHEVEVIEVIFRPQRKEWLLRFLVDKPQGGITVGECAQLNQEISQVLDEVNLIGHPYLLEVSSPGLDRPLKNEQDFKKVKGQLLKIVARVPLTETANEFISVELKGTLMQVKENEIILEEEESKKYWNLSYDSIVNAVREIHF